jgi:hypothetical protein
MALKMLCIPKREVDPASPYFKPVWAARYLNAKLNEFQRPNALSVYWYQRKNQQRREALPEKWQQELTRRYLARIDELCQAGPY